MQTFLFTDIEGSTRLWERHPAAMGLAIARQERILREAIGVRGGTVFNTAGDSVCAVFPAPDRAIAAAIDAQRRLLAETWDQDAPGLKLSVRMAVDAGDAEASGGNFVGPVLNRLHRLMKTGHGGQILCTSAIGLDDLGPDLRLRDLGSHPLRDIADELQLYQIVAPGLPAAFPPLTTDRPLPRQLPLPPVTLFGRDGELAEVDGLLRERTARLLTLLGPGGVGKTSLALALGRQLFDAFPDGVHFVDLSALREGTLVVPAISGVLEIEDPLLTPEDALLSRLQQRSLLLILDNCEQVVDAVAKVVRRLVGETESVIVLTTSRVPLRLRGEREVRIEPLPIPQPQEDAAINPAVQLFAEQARQVNNRFALNETAQPAVVEICRLLDGLPLAIELAAAWVRILDPATLQNRLAEGAPLLKSGTRDRPERHRTLTSTIDWSYQLLSPEAQWAFGRLAVFQGGIPFDGALAVLQDGARTTFVEALELIDTLVQANLLQAPTQTPDGPRYLMLQTIQEFGLSVLAPAEQLGARRAHAISFAAMASEAEKHYRGPEAGRTLARLDTNAANLRAAIHWLASPASDEPLSALHLSMDLWGYFDARGRYAEARESIILALEGAVDAPPALRAAALAILGHASLENYEQAETFYRRSIDEQAAIPEADPPFGALFGLASLAQVRGDYPTAIALTNHLRDLSAAADDSAAVAIALHQLGRLETDADRPDTAIAYFEAAIQRAEEMEHVVVIAWVHAAYASLHLWQDHDEQARGRLNQAIATFEEIDDRLAAAHCRLDLAWIAAKQSDRNRAITYLRDAVAEIAERGDRYSTHEALTVGAMVLLRLEHAPRLALDLLAAVDRWRASTGSVVTPARIPWETALRHEAELQAPGNTPAIGSAGASWSLRDAIERLRKWLDDAPPNGRPATQTAQSATFPSKW